MYCIDTPGVPESSDAGTFHCLYDYGKSWWKSDKQASKQELPLLNINTKASVSMQYHLKLITEGFGSQFRITWITLSHDSKVGGVSNDIGMIDMILQNAYDHKI